jgi:hypothetical protein
LASGCVELEVRGKTLRYADGAGQPYARAISRGTHDRIITQLARQVGRADSLDVRDGWWSSMEPAIRLSPDTERPRAQ